MQAIGHEVIKRDSSKSVCYITSETFLNEYINAISNKAIDAFRKRYRHIDLLLLDDVLSELDPRRQEFVLNRIGGGQTLITCCEDDQITKRTGGRVLTVHRGTIR
mgnify:CR=1 FL=1